MFAGAAWDNGPHEEFQRGLWIALTMALVFSVDCFVAEPPTFLKECCGFREYGETTPQEIVRLGSMLVVTILMRSLGKVIYKYRASILSIWHSLRLIPPRQCTPAPVQAGVHSLWRTPSRLQALVLWATAVAVLLAVLYPTTIVYVWAGEQWERKPPEFLKTFVAQFPSLQVAGQRKLRVTMGQWTEWRGTYPERRWDFKEEPDYDQINVEVGIALFIGIGLVIALGQSHR
jgi:hypothetical protein